MGKIAKFFQRLLSLSHSESKGFVKLLLVCIAALALLYLPKYFIGGKSKGTPKEIRELDSLVDLLENKSYLKDSRHFFSFDPNRILVDSLLLLGFDKYVAERLDKYRQKGGVFYDRGDLKKIYGLSNQFYT